METGAGKKKTKKQQKGPNQAMKDQLRIALREQEERERINREEEERKAREFELKEQERLDKVFVVCLFVCLFVCLYRSRESVSVKKRRNLKEK